jgi:hypothetical protein
MLTVCIHRPAGASSLRRFDGSIPGSACCSQEPIGGRAGERLREIPAPPTGTDPVRRMTDSELDALELRHELCDRSFEFAGMSEWSTRPGLNWRPSRWQRYPGFQNSYTHQELANFLVTPPCAWVRADARECVASSESCLPDSVSPRAGQLNLAHLRTRKLWGCPEWAGFTIDMHGRRLPEIPL